MRLSKYFSLAVATTSLTVLATYGARLNPTFLPLLAVGKLAIAICFSAYVTHEEDKQKKLAATAFTVGGWFGLFIGYADFLRVWWDYFSYDVIAWLVGIFILLITGIILYVSKQRLDSQKR